MRIGISQACLILSFLIPFESYAVQRSYCDTSKVNCWESCQSWGMSWTGESDPRVCCAHTGREYLYRGCFCQ